MGREENFGDYNDVRIDLQNAGGNKEALYNQIKQQGAREKAPQHRCEGGAIAIVVVGVVILTQRIVSWRKKRKQLAKADAVLKQQFMEATELESNQETVLEPKLKEGGIE